MKTRNWQTMVATLAVAGLAMSGSTAMGQNGKGETPVVSSSATPELTCGAQEVLQLEQAQVSDDTIIAFVNGSANNFALSTDQIVYLRQQGVSNAVIMAMLHKSGPVIYTPGTTSLATTTAANEAVVPPATGQAAPSSVYYEDDTPYYYSGYDYPYYYPYCYGMYPSVVFAWGWHGGYGWHGGGGWHGDGGGHGSGSAHAGGGFHGGGSFHGGGNWHH